ncbi:MAG: phosphatase PAP2 family protein [Halobacteriaceae archaeon]
MRDPATVAAAQSAVPGWAVPAVAAVTHLGEPVLLLAVLPPLYWLGERYGLVERRDGLRLVAVGVGGAGLVLALKAAFALQRPPSSLWLVHADGPAFPSGHATSATVMYGGLAYYLDRGRRRTRLAVAATLAVAVAASRVLLGVHYPTDVVAGVVVGTAYLAVATRVVADLDRAFPLASGLGLAALLATSVGPGDPSDGAVVLGAALGGTLAWRAVRDRTVTAAVPTPAFAVLGLAATLALFGVTRVLEPGALAAGAINSVTGVTVVGLPAAGQYFSR